MSAVDAPSDHVDVGVPWHFGDPLREQRRLQEGVAAVDLGQLPIIRVCGNDRKPWLHDLTTQDLTAFSGSALGLILSPHGHVEHELHMIDDGRCTWIIAQPGMGDVLLEYLERMRFMRDVAITDVSDEFTVIFEPVGEVDSNFPTWLVPLEFQQRGFTDAGSDRGGDASRYRIAALDPYVGREVIVPRTMRDERLDAWPHRAGTWAWQALRVASAMPRLGFETDHRTLPHEVGWVGPGVHLAKGCYRGQETVARVHNMGQPPRRMVLLHLDGSDDVLPEHGDEVQRDGRVVGWIGTAVQHWEHGPIATAIVKRATPVDQPLTVLSQGTRIAAHQCTESG